MRIDDVHKHYSTVHARVEVLRGISFELADGDSLAITGPSGSGKSTLLQIIGTLDEPSSGAIRINGREPFALPEPELARFRNSEIGFVFQDHHLLPQYSVLENVLIPTLAYPAGDIEAPRRRALELLERVELDHRLEHRPAELSGGERQRVAVARALVNGPSLLLCDEPTGSLDQATAGAVGDLLSDLHGDDSILIVVTHSLELAGRFERRCELREGLCAEL
ncbi:MAG: ABC transporter ATP-binding protein [bacterium]|nr:ABC transporter ATP-binding protein [bacterium]